MKESARLFLNLKLIQTSNQLQFNKQVNYLPSSMNCYSLQVRHGSYQYSSNISKFITIHTWAPTMHNRIDMWYFSTKSIIIKGITRERESIECWGTCIVNEIFSHSTKSLRLKILGCSSSSISHGCKAATPCS